MFLPLFRNVLLSTFKLFCHKRNENLLLCLSVVCLTKKASLGVDWQ